MHTSTALLLGYPVPHARFIQRRLGFPPLDPMADARLNDSSLIVMQPPAPGHSPRLSRCHRQHYWPVVTTGLVGQWSLLASLASGHVGSALACLRYAPIAGPDTDGEG
jgi:hypothetical protein